MGLLSYIEENVEMPGVSIQKRNGYISNVKS
jgi:hypothetical protein